jgi:ApaG protein
MPDKYNISVSADVRFLPERSSDDESRYVFAYTITIQNLGGVAAQLISRHWIITDADSKVQEVRGLGVVGKQPMLQPGDRFEYTSTAQIATAVGTMRGAYSMVAADGTNFDAAIPQFTLAAPRVLH